MTWRNPLSARLTRASALRLGCYAAAGVTFSLLAMACTITTDTGGGTGGGTPSGGTSSGGTSSGGSSSGGASTGGDVGTGGSGGGSTPQLDCHADGSVAGLSAEPGDGDDCWSCIMNLCPEEYGDCHAQDPFSICGYDSPDEEALGGEIQCMFDCFDDLGEAYLQQDVDECAEECGTAACSGSEATSITKDLAACAIGLKDDSFGCQSECGWRVD